MWSLIQKLKIPLRNRLNSEELKSQVYVDQLVTVISVAKQQTERNCNIAAFSKQRECIDIAYNSCPSCPSTSATGCCRQMMPPLAQCDKFQPSYVINAYLCLAMLHACTLECQHMMLCVWRWIPTKAERQWPTGEDHQAALATSGSTRSRRMPTLYCYCMRWRSEFAMGHGAAQRFTGTIGQRRRRWWWCSNALELGSLMTVSLRVSYWVCRWKNFENRSTFAKVMGN